MACHERIFLLIFSGFLASFTFLLLLFLDQPFSQFLFINTKGIALNTIRARHICIYTTKKYMYTYGNGITTRRRNDKSLNVQHDRPNDRYEAAAAREREEAICFVLFFMVLVCICCFGESFHLLLVLFLHLTLLCC